MSGDVRTHLADRRAAPPLIERASPTDVMELVCDVSGSSMQVAAVLVLETSSALDRPQLDLAAVRDAIDQRITAAPRLRQRLLDAPWGCGRPVWIDDPGFDIRNHVGGVGCPAPGDETAMLGVVADTITRRLPPDRPLWSATLITGLTGGRSALIVVFHHVLTDGIGGLAVLAELVDGIPAAAATDFPRPPPRGRELFADALGARGRALVHLPAALRRLRAAVAELGSGGTKRLPRSSLNRPIGPRRALAVARADLAAVRAAAHAHGATINDVVLAAVTGALRAMLHERGETVDRFVVSVPVSARREASATELGNRVGVIPVDIPATGEPTRRLARIAGVTRKRKTAAPGSSAALIGPVFRALAKVGAYGWFVNRQRMVNTFVTNLRGPDEHLAFLGAPVTGVIPLSGISGNVTVAFAALSYAGTLTVTVIADPERCPDVPVLCSALQRELDVLTGR